jgi:hypothetical protein
MAVGDVNSNEQGSGARFNDGKMKTEYVPLFTMLYMDSVRAIGEEAWNVLHMVSMVEARRLHHGCLMKYITSSDIADACEVLNYGAGKYAAWNWAKGQPFSVAMASLKRHLLAMAEGQVYDEESCCSHWGHIICNIIFLCHFLEFHPNMDDRPPEVCFGLTNDS